MLMYLCTAGLPDPDPMIDEDPPGCGQRRARSDGILLEEAD